VLNGPKGMTEYVGEPSGVEQWQGLRDQPPAFHYGGDNPQRKICDLVTNPRDPRLLMKTKKG